MARYFRQDRSLGSSGSCLARQHQPCCDRLCRLNQYGSRAIPSARTTAPRATRHPRTMAIGATRRLRTIGPIPQRRFRTQTGRRTMMNMSDLTPHGQSLAMRGMASDRSRWPLLLSGHRITALRSRLCHRIISPSGGQPERYRPSSAARSWITRPLSHPAPSSSTRRTDTST
jgi:hypothetical protein